MGKAATKAKNKYNKENYERINLVVSPEIKDKIKKESELSNSSVNGYINSLIKNELSVSQNFTVFWDNELVADVEVLEKSVHVRRYTLHPVKQIFYADEFPRYKLGEILELRCWDRNRADIQDCLYKIGLKEYNPYEICRKTHGITFADKIWFRYKGEQFDGVTALEEMRYV